jgi:hypothetical protein
MGDKCRKKSSWILSLRRAPPFDHQMYILRAGAESGVVIAEFADHPDSDTHYEVMLQRDNAKELKKRLLMVGK